MELKEFVAQTLQQIGDGVIAAQKYSEGKGVAINPIHLPVLTNQKDARIMYFSEDSPVFPVEFDVALTVTEDSRTKAGGGITVATIFKAGAGTESANASQTYSRVKFMVPVALPISSAERESET